MSINVWITLIAIAVMLLAGAWLANSIIILKKLKKSEGDAQEILDHLEHDNKNKTTEYSEKILEFTRTITAQVSILKFRTFVDSHEMAKVTQANVRKLVEEISRTVHDSMNIDNIDFEDTLFTKEFLESYIIETSSHSVKSLLDKFVNDEE